MSETLRWAILDTGAVPAPLLAPIVTHAETESHDSGEKPATVIVTLDLYDFTDVHGHTEQVKKKKVVREADLPATNCYLKQAQTTDPNSSFISPGDNIGTSPYISGSLKDNPTIVALNIMSPLASTIGNHEFSMGQAVLKQRVGGSNPGEFVQMGFPYLGTNIEGIGTWTKGRVEIPHPGDYKVWTSLPGVKVALIGAIAEGVPYKLSPDTIAGLSFADPLAKIDASVRSIKDKDGMWIVIAILDDDVKNNYPKVGEYADDIMGDDIHVPYELGKIDPAEKLDPKNPLLASVASGSYTDNLGLIRITYDTATKKVLSANTQLILAVKVAECGVDPETQAVANQAVTDPQEAGKTVVRVGYTQSLRRDVFAAPGDKTDPGPNHGIESSLGDLVADVMRETILVEGNTPADIGVISTGGLRDDLIPSGDGAIAYAQPYSVMLFSNELGYMSITGADFKRALEQQWKTDLDSQNSHPLLKLGIPSNVRYTYDLAEPYSQRITSAMVNDKPLDPVRVHTIGSVVFPLIGRDSFDTLTAGGPAKTNGNLDRDKFNEFLAAHSGTTPRVAKSSIGLSLPTEPLADGTSLLTPVRGLSSSEGSSITQNVTLSFDTSKGSSSVDNSLLGEYASDEAAIITTDGAGWANVEVKVFAGWHYGERVEGDAVGVPVSTSTDFVEVVTAGQRLSVPVVYLAYQVVPEPEGQWPTFSENNTGKSGKQTGEGSGNNLAKTGPSADVLGLGALVFALVGVGMLSRKRA